MKQLFKLNDLPQLRSRICEAVLNAPSGYIVEIKPANRTLDQNSLFHAICGDVSKQIKYMGKQLSPHQWKVLFISGHAIATGLGADVVPGIEGEFVNIRESSAQMTAKRMSSIIDYVTAWCSENNIRLTEKRYINEQVEI